MKEILKNPFTWLGLFFVGRYYLKNKPDSSTSRVIREITEGGTDLLDTTTDFVTDSVDIVTETTEDIFGVIQEVGFNTQETLNEVVQGAEQEAAEVIDGDTLPPDETSGEGDPSGGGGDPGFSGMKTNNIDDETTYYDGQPLISNNLEDSKFNFDSNVDNFSDNNPNMA
tara:strand:- start:664 stop:1170 length:507 start_codon:yes stop_codon:yes gene_type:complete